MGLILIVECTPPKESRARRDVIAFYYKGDGEKCERAVRNYCTKWASLFYPLDIASAIVSDNLPDNVMFPVDYDRNKGNFGDYFGAQTIEYWAYRTDYRPYQGRRRTQPSVFRVVGFR